jgi:hypothetical protein
MTLDEQIDARLIRRFKSEDRFLRRIERRENQAEAMIGELCRSGRTVYYVYPAGGKYKEGSRQDLIAYLLRKGYA